MILNAEQRVAAERHHTYMRGFSDGANGVWFTPREILEHQRDDLRDAYHAGLDDGRKSRSVANQDAREKYGYTPSVLR